MIKTKNEAKKQQQTEQNAGTDAVRLQNERGREEGVDQSYCQGSKYTLHMTELII